jgi:hypothetical protein
MKRHARLCPLCTHVIWPGGPVKLYTASRVRSSIEKIAELFIGNIEEGIKYTEEGHIMGCNSEQCKRDHAHASIYAGIWSGTTIVVSGPDYERAFW